MNLSLMSCHIILVISSPSSSTTGFLTLILLNCAILLLWSIAASTGREVIEGLVAEYADENTQRAVAKRRGEFMAAEDQASDARGKDLSVTAMQLDPEKTGPRQVGRDRGTTAIRGVGG